MPTDEDTDLNQSTDLGTTETDEVEGGSNEEVLAEPDEAVQSEKLSIRGALNKAVQISKDKEAGKTETSEAPVSPQPKSTYEAPKTWRKSLKASFAKLSPEEQKEFIDWENERETGLQRKFTEYGEKVKSAEGFQGVATEYADYFKALGVPPHEGAKNLIAADLYLSQDPIGALKWLAESKGVKLEDLVNSQKSYPPELSRHNIQNNDRLSRIEQMLNGFVQTETQKSTAMVEAEIENFVNATGDDGEPLRPYLHDDELKTAIGTDMELFAEKILKADPKKPIAKVLDEAYTKALRANDKAWEREQSKAETARKASLQKQAKAAKAAGSSVRGSPSGSTEFSPEGKSRRDIIEHLWRQGR